MTQYVETTIKQPQDLDELALAPVAHPRFEQMAQMLEDFRQIPVLQCRGLIERVPENLSLFLAGLGALLWFGRGGWTKALALIAVMLYRPAGLWPEPRHRREMGK